MFIDPICGSMIPVNCFFLFGCQNKQYLVNFTTVYMISIFEVFTNHKLDTFYLTESMMTQ